MAVSLFPYRWTLEEFLRAWEAGAFSKRTELIDGEVWDVPLGTWHTMTTGRVIRAMPNGTVEVAAGSLPSGPSLPEPDCWVLRGGAKPVEQLSPRMQRWAVEDVVLVVEIADETEAYDLGRKSVLYAETGYAHYWVATTTGVYVHSGPSPIGYQSRLWHGRGERLTVPYAPDVTLAVDDLLGPAA